MEILDYKKIVHITQVFGSIAKSLYIQFRLKIILLIKIICTWSNRISLIPPTIYTCKKLTSVLQMHTCKPIIVQVEKPLDKMFLYLIALNKHWIFVMFVHIYNCYHYFLKPWKHLITHVYLHTLIVVLVKHYQ